MADVLKGLTLCMITDALRRNNNAKAFMTKTVHCNVVYYCSTIAHMKDRTKSVPMQQHFRGKTTGRGRRVNLNTANEYFIHKDNHHFGIINNSLEALEQKERDEIAKEKERRKREKSK